jgi:hypothetical protein
MRPHATIAMRMGPRHGRGQSVLPAAPSLDARHGGTFRTAKVSRLRVAHIQFVCIDFIRYLAIV